MWCLSARHDEHGSYEGASTFVIEATTICEALSSSSNLPVTRLMIAFDRLDVINNLNSGHMLARYRSILKKIDMRKE